MLDSSNESHANWRLFKWIIGANRVLDKFTCPVSPFGNPDAHMAQHELEIVKLLGIQSDDFSYDLPVAPDIQQRISAWLQQNNLKQYVLLNPTGCTAQKRFSPNTLLKLSAELAANGLSVVIPAEPHSPWHQIAFPNLPVYVKQTPSVFDLFELIKRSCLVVTPDTAVMHAASGFARPTLAFYNEYCPQNDPANPLAILIKTEADDINQFAWSDWQQGLASLKKHIKP